MRTINISERSRDKLLHVEAPGCIINIRVGMSDAEGRVVTNVLIQADGNRYSGDPEWWIEGEEGKTTAGVRVICMRRK